MGRPGGSGQPSGARSSRESGGLGGKGWDRRHRASGASIILGSARAFRHPAGGHLQVSSGPCPRAPRTAQQRAGVGKPRLSSSTCGCAQLKPLPMDESLGPALTPAMSLGPGSRCLQGQQGQVLAGTGFLQEQVKASDPGALPGSAVNSHGNCAPHTRTRWVSVKLSE